MLPTIVFAPASNHLFDLTRNFLVLITFAIATFPAPAAGYADNFMCVAKELDCVAEVSSQLLCLSKVLVNKEK